MSTMETFLKNRLELAILTNSLASTVRWRYQDYASFLLRELEMLSTENLVAEPTAKQRHRMRLQ